MTHSKEVREILYWLNDKEWYTHDPNIEDQREAYRLTDKAPQKAHESFEKWKKQYH